MMTCAWRWIGAICVAVPVVLVLPAAALAQDEAVLKSSFEGRRVTVRIDMPGTSDGVDVRADARQAMDFASYRSRLKSYGVAIGSGETVLVTLVKVKKDVIEFQLGGGGYGTFGDDTSTSVYIPYVGKSRREEELEKRIDREDDRERRRAMQRELDELRDRRRRENRRIEERREEASARKAELIAERRLHGGSRFNIRYEGAVPHGIGPEEVMASLAEYVDFSGLAPRASSTDLAPPPPGGPIDLRKGMTRADVESALGRPAGTSERREGGIAITTLTFDRGDQRVTAELVEDVLVRYAIASR